MTIGKNYHCFTHYQLQYAVSRYCSLSNGKRMEETRRCLTMFTICSSALELLKLNPCFDQTRPSATPRSEELYKNPKYYMRNNSWSSCSPREGWYITFCCYACCSCFCCLLLLISYNHYYYHHQANAVNYFPLTFWRLMSTIVVVPHR